MFVIKPMIYRQRPLSSVDTWAMRFIWSYPNAYIYDRCKAMCPNAQISVQEEKKNDLKRCWRNMEQSYGCIESVHWWFTNRKPLHRKRKKKVFSYKFLLILRHCHGVVEKILKLKCHLSFHSLQSYSFSQCVRATYELISIGCHSTKSPYFTV